MKEKLIFFKADFAITEHSEAGYGVPFRFRYYTGSPARAFVVSFDGTEFHNCHLNDDGDLVIGFDDHRMGLGKLMVQRTYYLDNEAYASGICDAAIAPEPVIVDEIIDADVPEDPQTSVDVPSPSEQDGDSQLVLETPSATEVEQYYLVLSLQGSTSIAASSTVEPYWAKGDPGDSAYQIAVEHGYVGTEEEWLASLVGPQGPAGPQGPRGYTGDCIYPVFDVTEDMHLVSDEGIDRMSITPGGHLVVNY